MSLIKIDTQPITKLIETVSKGIGILYEPIRLKKQIDIEAYRIEKIAEAEANVRKTFDDNSETQELIDRVNRRVLIEEINKQINLESIIQKSIESLKDEVSKEPVDSYWRSRFFKHAQDITDEELQNVWAKILAEEINQPGNMSIRTLEIISNLSKPEAEIFERASKLSLDNDGVILLAYPMDNLTNYGISFNDLLILSSAGLLYSNTTLDYSFPKEKPTDTIKLYYGEKIIQCKNESVEAYYFDQISFTPAGEELMKITRPVKNLDYINYFIEQKSKEGYEFIFIK